MIYKEIKNCRICGNTNLVQILNLGSQMLTGVFPTEEEHLPSVPIELVSCKGNDSCGLVQLKHTVDVDLMYGSNYGYRSGLNKSMVLHLQRLTDSIIKNKKINLAPGD